MPSKKKDGSRKPWVGTFYDAGGRRHQKRFATRGEARAWEESQRTAVRSRTYVDRSHKVTLADWLDEWSATTVHLRPSTRAQRSWAVREHLVPALGSYPLTAVTRADVRGLVADSVERGLAPSTVRKIWQVLHMALEAAVDDDLIGANPARKAKLPQISPKSKARALNPSQVQALVDACRPEYRAALWLGVMGLRAGEICAVRRSDFTDGLMVVSRQVTEVAGRAEEVDLLKARHSDREFQLPRFMVAELERHCATYGVGPGELLFSAERGGLMLRTFLRRGVVVPAAKASIGLPFTTHDLRHTARTLLASMGIPEFVIDARIGHGPSGSTGARYYTHVLPEVDAQAADVLDELFGGGGLGAMRLVRTGA